MWWKLIEIDGNAMKMDRNMMEIGEKGYKFDEDEWKLIEMDENR